MQVNCPNCGERVTADKINIQKMTAVCAACDTVFPFDLPKADIKSKRRKVKQPARLTVHDDNAALQMEFWTNFRLDRNEAFLSRTLGGVSMTLVALMLIRAPQIPPIMPFLFLFSAVVLFYLLALVVVNRTQIEMDEDTIKVTRKPIPNPLNQGYEISLAGVAAIKYEETAASKKEAYDTPRYQVWAETADGNRRMIVNDVIEDYAVFIAQHLQERLQADDERDVSRLEEDEHRSDDQDEIIEVVRASRNTAQQ